MTFDLATGIPVLERTPQTLRAMLAGLPDEWTDATEGPGSWSPRVVVAHLLHADRTNWMVRARMILDHRGGRALPEFDPAGQFRECSEKPLVDLLDEFENERAQKLATLRSWRIGEDALGLTAEHPEFGTVALRQLLATWVAHDLAHVAQIARVMAKRYRDAVGPWRAYLPIMDR